jgi:hypothetical protein
MPSTQKSRQQLDDRRFATAVRPQEAEHFPVLHRDIHIRDGGEITEFAG